jgi:aspartyl-tRNA(Asn)/glutamyl-tRNA(Gln) amidotransferase subunit C
LAEKLDEAAVRHVAHLARLKITEQDAALYAGQLSRILEYVRQLNELDTSAVEPTAHPLPIADVFRDDAIRPSWSGEDALSNAPQRHGEYFRVPKVLDQEEA